MTPTPAFLDGIGFSEMLVIAFIAILVFGGKLPDALKNMGRGYAKFRKSIQDVSRPLRDEIQRATTLPPDVYTPSLPRPPVSTLPPAQGGAGAAPAPGAPPASGPGVFAPYGVGAPAADPSGDLTKAVAPPSAAPTTPGRSAADFDDEPPPV